MVFQLLKPKRAGVCLLIFKVPLFLLSCDPPVTQIAVIVGVRVGVGGGGGGE